MARPVSPNEEQQKLAREAFIWMAELFRTRSRERGQPNPLKQESVAAAIGITQGSLSRWLMGATKTLQKGEAWSKLIKLLCDAREKLPQEGWRIEPHLYWHNGVWCNLHFEAETGDAVFAYKKEVICDSRCYNCHGLTPGKGMFCMHCGAVILPKWELMEEDEFLLPGDSWKIDIKDYSREPVGHKNTKTHLPPDKRYSRI